MVRKQTWVLLAVFAVLLGITFYLQKNPLPASASKTPSPTAAPKLLQGWEVGDIVFMEVKDSQSGNIQISQDAQGNWMLETGGKEKVSTGLAEEIRNQIVEMRITASLPAGYQLSAVGLDNPTRAMTIRNKQGKQTEIRIGKADPTDSGYYVQVDGQSVVVVEKTTLDGTLDLFKNALPTPTPTVTAPATGTTNPQQATGTPTP